VGQPGLRVAPGFADRQIFHTGSWSGFRALATYQPEADVHVISCPTTTSGGAVLLPPARHAERGPPAADGLRAAP
jgi:hypothetical protein